ncbi:MAG: Spy/CpxP family protein refolding chaperone [Polyangiaceae bacterium]
MHPAFYYWWKKHHARHEGGEPAHCAPSACGPRGGGTHGHREDEAHAHAGEYGGGGSIGVRRPLRFLAHRLSLSEEQVAKLARVLDELKTERAQAEVDQRRTATAFAAAIESAEFGAAKADEGAKLREESAARVQKAVSVALREIHALLTQEQRETFAYLLRTGALSM